MSGLWISLFSNPRNLRNGFVWRFACQGFRLRPLLSMAGAAFLAVISGCASLDTSATARLVAPLRDGIIAGELGEGLPERARKQAVQAEYKALESGLTGAPVEWRSGDIQGTVTPQQPYSVGSNNCRRYTHTISQDGSTRSATGTACRREDSSWRPLS